MIHYKRGGFAMRDASEIFVCLAGATVKNCENNGEQRAIFATAQKKDSSPKAKNPFFERQAEASI